MGGNTQRHVEGQNATTLSTRAVHLRDHMNALEVLLSDESWYTARETLLLEALQQHANRSGLRIFASRGPVNYVRDAFAFSYRCDRITERFEIALASPGAHPAPKATQLRRLTNWHFSVKKLPFVSDAVEAMNHLIAEQECPLLVADEVLREVIAFFCCMNMHHLSIPAVLELYREVDDRLLSRMIGA